MRTFDISPLFRSAVGFDRLGDLLDAAVRNDQPAYPPYNIERTGDDRYRITMAVAGFVESDLKVESEQNVLKVSGAQPEDRDEDREFLHRGIGSRNFERQFQLADHVKVTGASLENGMLHIELVHELPEAMKPRQIKIQSSRKGKLLGNKAA